MDVWLGPKISRDHALEDGMLLNHNLVVLRLHLGWLDWVEEGSVQFDRWYLLGIFHGFGLFEKLETRDVKGVTYYDFWAFDPGVCQVEEFVFERHQGVLEDSL